MSINIVFWIVLLAALVVAVFATVVSRTLMVATAFLALSSVLLAVFLYFMDMHWAAVMELAVSAGLMTAIFASAIAMLNPKGDTSEGSPKRASRLKRYLPLPFVMLIIAAAVLFFFPGMGTSVVQSAAPANAPQMVLWSDRALDIVGMSLLILAGVLGVAALIRRSREEK